MRKSTAWLLGAAGAAIAGVGLAFHYLVPYFIIRPTRYATLFPSPYENPDLRISHHAVTTDSGFALATTRIFPPDKEPRALLIVLHGIGGAKENWVPLALNVAPRGIGTVLVDIRGHGGSGGRYTTFGYHERQDISRVVDQLREEYPDTPIGVWGHSLGGAIALQSMADDKRIAFGLSLSTFANLAEIVYDYQHRLSGFTSRRLAAYFLRRAAEIGGFDSTEVRPEKAAARIDRPVMIIHGTADPSIDVANAHRIFDALPAEDKELILVPGADHNNVVEAGGPKFLNRVMTFIDRQIAAHATDSEDRLALDPLAGKTTSSRSLNKPVNSYKNRTKKELYELAREMNIGGRSSMSKRELIAALIANN